MAFRFLILSICLFNTLLAVSIVLTGVYWVMESIAGIYLACTLLLGIWSIQRRLNPVDESEPTSASVFLILLAVNLLASMLFIPALAM